jgi:hypothetical protein
MACALSAEKAPHPSQTSPTSRRLRLHTTQRRARQNLHPDTSAILEEFGLVPAVEPTTPLSL